MLRLEPAAIALSYLTERQQAIVRMRLAGTACSDIAATLGISRSQVSVALRRAKGLPAKPEPSKKSCAAPRALRARAKRLPGQAWLDRQIERMRSMDEEGCNHWLHCIEITWGERMRERVERAT